MRTTKINPGLKKMYLQVIPIFLVIFNSYTQHTCIPSGNNHVIVQTDVTLDIHLINAKGISGSLTINKGASLYTTIYNVEIKPGGRLTVDGEMDVYNLIIFNSSVIRIKPSSKVTVYGDLIIKNDGYPVNSYPIQVDGYIDVKGNLYNEGIITGSGNIIVAGNITNNGMIGGVTVNHLKL